MPARTPNLELADKAVRAPAEGRFCGKNRGFSQAVDSFPGREILGEGKRGLSLI
jgi:hypothetical protein